MDVTSKLQTFIEQHTGVANVGDTPQNKGQCVGLVEVWLDLFSLPHIWGNATDLPTNAPTANYTVINNTPTGSPSPGDVFVLKEPYGAITQNDVTTYLGHCGVVVNADLNQVTMFEANDPNGAAPQIKSYAYTNDCQWIHPNIFTPTVNQTVTDPQLTDQLNAEIAALNSCQTQLKDATEQNAILQKNNTDLQNQLDNVQGELKDAKSQISTLQIQCDNEQKEIVHLHATIEAQAKTGVDDNTKILDLSHENTALTNSFNSVVDGLGVVRTSKTLDQITKDALSKEDELDTLLKAAGVVEGLLHNMAATLQLDDPNATDQQVANNIITYVKNLQGKLQNLATRVTGSPEVPETPQNPISKFFIWLGLWQQKN